MTDPDRQHTAEPAEGADPPGSGQGGQTPHPEQPAEGQEQGQGQGADTPDA